MEQYTFLSVDDIITPSISEAINSTDSQLDALQDDQLVTFVKWLNGELIRLSYTAINSGMGLSFLRKSKPFKIYAKTTLNGIVLADAATIVLTDASNWDSTGRSVIESTRNSLDFVDHQSKASNTLTVLTTDGAETVAIRHESGESISRLIPLPSDYAKMRELKINEREFFPWDGNGFPTYGKYSMQGGYVFLPRGLQNVDGTFFYNRKATSITERTGDGSTTDIPEDALRWAIEMTLFHLFRIRRKRNDLQTTDQLAQRYLQEFLTYDAQFSTDNDLSFG